MKVELKHLRLFLDTVFFNSLLCKPLHFIVNFLNMSFDWPVLNHLLVKYADTAEV